MISRLSKDDYFMLQALSVRLRSHDESTRHGCVIVGPDGQVLAQGYNGFPIGCPDHLMPQTRPEKYSCILHSEENAFLNCNVCLKNCTLYVSGHPCTNCFARSIQKGITRILYGPVKCKGDNYQDLESNSLIKLMNQNRIKIEEWAPENLGLLLDELNEMINLIRGAGD